MQEIKLNQITGDKRKTFMIYADAQEQEKAGKATQKEHKPAVIKLFDEYGTITSETATTTTMQFLIRDDNVIHTAQMETCRKVQSDTAAYIAYLESLLEDNGIYHKVQSDFTKIVTSCTIRRLTAEKTKKAVKR